MTKYPTILLSLLIWPLALQADKGQSEVPPKAKAVISQVRQAAEQQDYRALRKLMVSDFGWSFASEDDADAAITEWKKDPGMLPQLAHVLETECILEEPGVIECPGDNKPDCEELANGEVACDPTAETGWRAGFTKTRRGWLFQYFVAGD